MQRILKVEYEFPPHVRVSRECRDLLKQILIPEPGKRYKVVDIQQHPWYCKDLPPGVREMNDNLPPPPPGLQVNDAILVFVRASAGACQCLSSGGAVSANRYSTCMHATS